MSAPEGNGAWLVPAPEVVTAPVEDANQYPPVITRLVVVEDARW
jgi:hypothetical protein